MNYYQHHIGDYRADTSHLSLLEHGAYRQLIDWYYLNEAPIPKETQVVFRRLSARTQDEQNAVLAVLSDFFTESEGGFSHKRCDDEICKYQEKAEKNRQNGAKGGRPSKKNSENDEKKPKENPMGFSGKPNETLTNNQEPLTNNHKPIKKPSSAKASVAFDEFWKAYPKKQGKGDAERAFKKIKPDQELLKTILEAIEDQKGGEAWMKDAGQYIPNPATWLNGKRWEDEVKPHNPDIPKDKEWFESASGITSKAKELGIPAIEGEIPAQLRDRIYEHQRMGAH